MGLFHFNLNPAIDVAKKAETKIAAAVPQAGWLSRKLWIFAAVVFVLIWLGRADFTKLFENLLWITAIYLVCQTAHDIANDFINGWVQRGRDRCAADIQCAPYGAHFVMATPLQTMTATASAGEPLAPTPLQAAQGPVIPPADPAPLQGSVAEAVSLAGKMR